MASHADLDVCTDRLADLPINDVPSKTLNLSDLAHEILIIVVESLFSISPWDVRILAHSSRALRRAALPTLYRTMILQPCPIPGSIGKAYHSLVDIFRYANDGEFIRHVHTIMVRDTVPETDLLLVLNKIASHGQLRKLSWQTSTHMPRSVYDLIHEKWPQLDLEVFVMNRSHKDPAHRQMDTRLLSSPLLTTLIYSLYNQGYFQAYLGDQAVRSEWPQLTQCIIAGGNVRNVRIYNLEDKPSILSTNSVLVDDRPMKLPRFDATADTRLPALEELCLTLTWPFGGLTYLWDVEHCRLMRDAMDWSRMRKLDFGNDNPGAFLQIFTGRISNLKSLRFGVESTSINIAKEFIESVPALDCLDIAQADIAVEQLWPTIMKHKNTLKELLLRPSRGDNYQLQLLDMSYLETVAQKLPMLERLGWIVPCDESIDAEYLAMLCHLNLRKVDLFIHLPMVQTDFCSNVWQDVRGSIPPPPLYPHACDSAAITIMEMVDQCQERLLERVTFHFSRFGMAAMARRVFMEAKYQLRRRAKFVQGDALQGRGRLAWYGPASHQELLSLELEDTPLAV